MYAVGMLTPVDRLYRDAPYRILHMERIGEGQHLLAKLWEEWNQGAGQFVFIILPDMYASYFSSARVVAVNSCAVLFKLILLGFTPRGQPVLRFHQYTI